MELYTDTSYALARQLTLRYSTSFSQSSSLFSTSIRKHIFAIYGLVRIADEIVDTYQGASAATLLTDFEAETYAAIEAAYSTNPIIHAFAVTARKFSIDTTLIGPFFESMRMDLIPAPYTSETYSRYIYGSAEVIGLMCLKVFTEGDEKAYRQLEPSASALGAAYQKVNFLRDFASDYYDRQRVYFPNVQFDSFDEAAKAVIIRDIEHDFDTALPGLAQLPTTAKKAVTVSYMYYSALLKKLKTTPAETLQRERIRIPNWQKTALFVQASLKRGV